MSVTLSLAGKVALISGGARGIGAATVRLFAQAGARVYFNFEKSKSAAEALCRELGEENCRAMACPLEEASKPAELVEACVREFGRLDILVANHGIWRAEDISVDLLSEEQWRKTISINLDAVFSLVKHSVTAMKARAAGSPAHIVLISSTAGQRGEALHCDYAASKGALISLAKGLSTELAPDQIYVNCVAPGWVATEMSQPALSQADTARKILASIPLGRVGTPEEIAAAVLFLCTPLAGFITGEILNVNGGAVLVG
ncbi:MAG: SDR family oxidoreductase [Acidobacteria bacterium]|nr:SDR family oxidoreductase [Acidobacteriota bacterium]